MFTRRLLFHHKFLHQIKSSTWETGFSRSWLVETRNNTWCYVDSRGSSISSLFGILWGRWTHQYQDWLRWNPSNYQDFKDQQRWLFMAGWKYTSDITPIVPNMYLALQMERITSSVTMTQRSQLMTLYGMKDHLNPMFSLALDPFRLVEITRLPLFS